MAPPRIKDADAYWELPPPVQSARCTWWVKRIAAGWRPNRRVRALGYYAAARFYGVWIWEYLHVIYPLLEMARAPRP